MNLNKFFKKAKEEGIEVSEVSFSKTASKSFSLFHKELDNYSISNQSTLKARGIYKDKLGVVRTEDVTDASIPYLISTIKSTASIIEKNEEPIIFKGSKKYHKKNMFNKELNEISVDKKLEILHQLEDLAYAYDKRITEVEVSYSENESELMLANSYGLKLKSHNNYFYYYLSVVAKDGEEVKSDGDIFLDSDFSKFEPKIFVKKICDKVLSKFHGITIKSQSYKAVLNPEVVSQFVNALISTSCSAENIQKKSSLFVGKLGNEILSKKVTIEEKPLLKNCFFTYFDHEGVATYNKKIFDKGVLKTYLYNLETAKKDGVESTGNGYGSGSKIGIDVVNLYLKPGKLSEEDLFKKIKKGVYITSITGLHAGLNPQSGDFSLQAEGFIVENGKVTSPLSLITVGGNLVNILRDVLAVGNNSQLQLNGTTAPSIAIKNLKVSA